MDGQLLTALVDAGLIQFGSFARPDGSRAPFLARLELLASYPTVLDMMAGAAQRLTAGLGVSRLLCAADAIPLGTALAMRLDVPLVYSRGTNEPAVTDLVGAYDIGHRTLVLVNVLEDDAFGLPWVARARGVGLETAHALAVLDARPVGQGEPENVDTLLSLGVLADALVERGSLPPGQAVAVHRWLARAG